MKTIGVMALALALAGCSLTMDDLETGPPERPSGATETTNVEPAQHFSALHHGTVTWDLVDSDCAPEELAIYDEQHFGALWVDGSTVHVDLWIMPTLSGLVSDDQVRLTGFQQFMGETGASVSCQVDGDARVGTREVTGVLTEALTSEGDVNCSSTARFTLNLNTPLD